MPSNRLTLVVQVDSATANQSVANFNKAVASIEASAAKAGGGASRSIQNFERTTVRATARITSEIQRLGAAIGATSLVALGTAAVNVAADFEIASIGMEALLGSAEKGQKVFSELQQFAFESPFQFKDLLLGAQRLSAVGFQAEEILPTLKAVSTAVAAIGGPSADRLNDVIRAFGDMRAAGRLTGEEFRQLKNTAIPVLDILSKKFKLAPKEVKDAIESGRIGAEQSIRALSQGMEQVFSPFRERILGTFKVSVSNLIDALSKFAYESTKDKVLPALTRRINELRKSLQDLTGWFQENQTLIFGIAESLAKLAAAMLAIRAAAWILGPLIAFFKAPALAAFAINLKTVLLYLDGLPTALTAAQTSLLGLLKWLPPVAIGLAALWGGNKLLQYRQGNKELDQTKEKLRQIREQVKDDPRFSRVHGMSVADTAYTNLLNYVRRTTDAKQEATDTNFELDASEEELANKIKRTAEILRDARLDELEALPRIIAQYKEYRKELGVTEEANRNLAQATEIRIRQEVRKLQQRSSAEDLKATQEEYDARLKFATDQYNQVREFELDTLSVQLQNIDTVRDAEQQAIDYRRDYRLRQIEATAGEDVASQLDVVQQTLQIETAYIQESANLHAKQIEERYAREVGYLESLLRIYPERQVEIQGRIEAIVQTSEIEQQRIRAKATQDASLLEIEAANRSRSIIRDHTLDTFNELKSSAGRVFDNLLHKAESVWDAIANALKTAVLTVIKEIVSSQIALMLTRLLTGNTVGFARGGGGGALGGLGRILGGLGVAAPVFGGGVGYPGAPGGTPGFAGPVRGLGGLGGFGGFGGAGGLRGLLGIGGSVQLGPGVATTWEAASLLQKIGAIGKSPAAAFGGGLLAFEGLRRGGAAGLGMTTAGGALIGYKFGGPLGAAIGGIAGAVAGTIRLMYRGALERTRDKIQALYRITIHEKNILRQIVDTARQTFGGNLDLAIRSEQVRELIDLYAMSTGQTPRGGYVGYRATSLVQSGGTLSSVLAPTPGTALTGTPQPVGASGPVVIQSLTLQVNGQSAADVLEGRTATVISRSGRQIQESSLGAQRANVGRRTQTALQFAPGLVPA